MSSEQTVLRDALENGLLSGCSGFVDKSSNWWRQASCRPWSATTIIVAFREVEGLEVEGREAWSFCFDLINTCCGTENSMLIATNLLLLTCGVEVIGPVPPVNL